MSSVGELATRGALWNVGTTFVTRALGLVGTMVLTHFIAPGENGQVSAAFICVASAAGFSHLRFGTYVIAKKAPAATVFNANVIHLVTGFIALCVVVALRNRLGAIFHAPDVGRFIPGFALAAMIERLGYIPDRTLVRSLQFRPLSIARAVGDIAFTSVSLGTAPFYGGMALVFGNVVRASIVTGLTIRASRWEEYGPRAPLSWTTIRDMLKYCAPLVVSGIAEIASAKWDNLLMSRFFGPTTMGQYNLAYNLVEAPTGAVADQVGDVLLPAFAQLDAERRERAVFRATRLMGIIVFPLGVGLAAVAPTAVVTFFDARWAPMTNMLIILSVLAVARPASYPIIAFMQSQHRQHAFMALSLGKVVVLLGSIWIFARFGPLWACGGVGFTFMASTLTLMIMARVLDKVKILPLLLGLIPVLASCGAMGASVVLVRHGLRSLGLGPGWSSLSLEIITGAVSYIAACFIFARPVAMDLLKQARKVIDRKRGIPTPEDSKP